MENIKSTFLRIEVLYADSNLQLLITLQVAAGSSVYEVIKLSGITQGFPQLDYLHAPIGVWNKKIDPQNYILKNFDRIEIYRPLTQTPNQKRLRRAKEEDVCRE